MDFDILDLERLSSLSLSFPFDLFVVDVVLFSDVVVSFSFLLPSASVLLRSQ